MVLNALITDPRNTGITFGIILLGVPVFWVRLAALRRPNLPHQP
jgi:hypothetical protein